MPDPPAGAHPIADPDLARADMRIEIVKREISQGALAGFSAEISDYAARLIIAALDSFDVDAEQRAYASGFKQGVAFQKARQGHPDG